MKQNFIIIIVSVMLAILLAATAISVKRAETASLPSKGQQSEDRTGTSEQETTEQEGQETTEQVIDQMDYVTYTGEAHAGTGIAYRGSGENAHKVIVIDAGHQLQAMRETEPDGPGSETTKAKVSAGTQGSFTGLCEYELTLRVALALRDVLVQKGYCVVMVRETNEVEISNAERALLANHVGADVNIRIHANGDDNASRKGAMTICATADNAYNAHLYDASRLLSDTVLQAFCQGTGMEQLEVWETDTMTGINWATVPTTIIEMGFMTNREDDTAMAENGFADVAARALAEGIEAYFAQSTADQDTTLADTAQQEQTEPSLSEYDIDYALEAELGCTFRDVYTTVVVTGANYVWVRTEPSTRGGDTTCVYTISGGEGSTFICIGWGEKWHRLLIDGKVYYMSAAYLEEVTE